MSHKLKVCAVLLCAPLAGLYFQPKALQAAPILLGPKPAKMLDFSPGYNSNKQFSGFSQLLSIKELASWGAANQLDVDDDSPMFRRQNHLCAFVDVDGASLWFEVNEARDRQTEQELLIDFVVFRPRPKKVDSFVMQKLKIFVADKPLKSIDFGYGKLLKNPVRINIDPEYFPDGKIHIRLVPSRGVTPLWAVWDIGLKGGHSVRGKKLSD